MDLTLLRHCTTLDAVNEIHGYLTSSYSIALCITEIYP